jgi:hypothetical protein
MEIIANIIMTLLGLLAQAFGLVLSIMVLVFIIGTIIEIMRRWGD